MRRSQLIPAAIFLIGFLSGALAVGGYQHVTEIVSAQAPLGAGTAQLQPGLPSDEVPAPIARVAAPIREEPSTEDHNESSAPEGEPADLEVRLEGVVNGWSRMEAQLERLSQRVARIEVLQDRVAVLERRLADAAGTGSMEEASVAVRARTPEARRGALEQAGVGPQRAADIVWREAQHELDQLDLRDQAVREGWFATDRYREELQRLRDQRPDMRAELGDEAYDRYLFAAGEENRVQISSVIPGSAADGAGLMPGDLIETYDGARIFNLPDLRGATADGERGELVGITIRRADGSTVEAWVPRGPLGIHLDLARARPDA
jgi:hypothetical protein